MSISVVLKHTGLYILSNERNHRKTPKESGNRNTRMETNNLTIKNEVLNSTQKVVSYFTYLKLFFPTEASIFHFNNNYIGSQSLWRTEKTCLDMFKTRSDSIKSHVKAKSGQCLT